MSGHRPWREIKRKSAAKPPTAEELEAARVRLEPYFKGYPQPMIDARRLRISGGTAAEQDYREIAAEDAIIREFARPLLGLSPETKPDATVEEVETETERTPEEVLRDFISASVLSYRMVRVGPDSYRHIDSPECEHCQAVEALEALASRTQPLRDLRLISGENDTLRSRLEDVIIMLEEADKQVKLLQTQLDQVDNVLPRWETDRGFEPVASGRVQTILNLLEDREGLKTYQGYVEQLRQDLKSCHTDRQHRLGTEIATLQTRLDFLMAYLESSPDVPPAVIHKIKKDLL